MVIWFMQEWGYLIDLSGNYVTTNTVSNLGPP